MKTLRYILFLLLSFTLYWTAKAQPSPVRVTPDCVQNFAFTTSGQTSVYNNFSNGIQCNTWTMSYSSTSFSAVSVIVETAPDAGGTPSASWSTFTATGNPASSTTSVAIQMGGVTSYFPWLRVRLASATPGSTPPANLITGILQGWRVGSSPGSGGGGGGPTTDVNIAEVGGSATVTGGVSGLLGVAGPAAVGAAPSGNPNYVAGLDSAGNLFPFQFCTLSAVINTASSGKTQIIAASSSKKVYVCSVSLTSASAVSVQFFYGTGSNCASSPVALTGNYGSSVGIGSLALDQVFDPFITPASQAVCISLDFATQVDGTVTYAQR